MRENRTSGSEGGAAQANALSLPLLLAGACREVVCVKFCNFGIGKFPFVDCLIGFVQFS